MKVVLASPVSVCKLFPVGLPRRHKARLMDLLRTHAVFPPPITPSAAASRPCPTSPAEGVESSFSTHGPTHSSSRFAPSHIPTSFTFLHTFRPRSSVTLSDPGLTLRAVRISLWTAVYLLKGRLAATFKSYCLII